MSNDMEALTVQQEQQFLMNLLQDGEANLWNYPTLQYVYQLLADAGFDTQKVHISGYESGGLAVFLSNGYSQRKSFKELKAKLLAELALPA